MSLRAIKEAARADLHEAMRVPAFYFSAVGAAHQECTVRVHTQLQKTGDLAGTNFNYAETQEAIPKLVFWRDEGVVPLRGGMVMISAEEGYKVDHTEPVDGQTVTVHVIRLSAADRALLTYPGA